jgi:SET domain-containing protein
MILPFLFIAPAAGRGRGVFTDEPIAEGTYVEVSPVIVFGADDRQRIDQTILYNYIFDWNTASGESCMALGYIPIYNHSYTANCDYEMDHDAQIIRIKAVRAIEKGEELFINYNGMSNDPSPVWFDVS